MQPTRQIPRKKIGSCLAGDIILIEAKFCDLWGLQVRVENSYLTKRFKIKTKILGSVLK